MCDFTLYLSAAFAMGRAMNIIWQIKLLVSEVQGGREGVKKDQSNLTTVEIYIIFKIHIFIYDPFLFIDYENGWLVKGENV